jgi:hypothetical protein
MVAGMTSPRARGAVVITIGEQGPNVVLVGSGTLNTDALTLLVGGYASAVLQPNIAQFIGGSTFSLVSAYEGVIGPASIGPSSVLYTADVSGGHLVGVIGGSSPAVLLVPEDYVSGSALASNATFTGHGLASLGLAEGSYVWTWGSGPTADSLTLNVIPESSTALITFLGLSLLLRRQKRNSRA